MRIDDEKADELLREWQHRLGLDDWRIELCPHCDPTQMSLHDVEGCSVWTESIKAARIEVLDEAFYCERIVPYDFERTLVHELLHLKLSLVSDQVEPLQERYMHQIIDDLARAMVDAKRYPWLMSIGAGATRSKRARHAKNNKKHKKKFKKK